MSFFEKGRRYKLLIEDGLNSHPSIYTLRVDFETKTHVGGVDIRGTRRMFRKDTVLRINDFNEEGDGEYGCAC